MIYLDSSALLKHYVREAGTDVLEEKLNEASSQHRTLFVSVLGYAEILATFARRIRDNHRFRMQIELLQEQFNTDWMFEINHVELNARVLLFVPRLVNSYPLKDSDAVHLASGLWLRDALKLGMDFGHANRKLTFATSDKQLKRAVLAEGLELFDPEAPK